MEIYSCKRTQIINLNFQLKILKRANYKADKKEENKGEINNIKRTTNREKIQ